MKEFKYVVTDAEGMQAHQKSKQQLQILQTAHI